MGCWGNAASIGQVANSGIEEKSETKPVFKGLEAMTDSALFRVYQQLLSGFPENRIHEFPN
jgi:hypothetical protein